jgi:hypothetical protein
MYAREKEATQEPSTLDRQEKRIAGQTHGGDAQMGKIILKTKFIG